MSGSDADTDGMADKDSVDQVNAGPPVGVTTLRDKYGAAITAVVAGKGCMDQIWSAWLDEKRATASVSIIVYQHVIGPRTYPKYGDSTTIMIGSVGTDQVALQGTTEHCQIQTSTRAIAVIIDHQVVDQIGS